MFRPDGISRFSSTSPVDEQESQIGAVDDAVPIEDGDAVLGPDDVASGDEMELEPPAGDDDAAQEMKNDDSDILQIEIQCWRFSRIC